MSCAATLSVNLNANNIEDVSNFVNGSFVITNTGTCDIEYIELDVSDSLFPDSVFDPFGVAGDTVAKIFTPQGSTANATGMVTPVGGFGPSAIGKTYIGPGGVEGFSKIRVEFTDFNPGEVFSFGVDMDPNSVAGSSKNPLEAAAPVPGAGGDNEWHVGAISGAELIGSTFTAGFAGGFSTSGQLMGQGNNAVSGSIAEASLSSRQIVVGLQVNGLGAGSAGSYTDGGPTVTIQGPDGETARIALAKGISTPFSNPFTGAYGDQFQAQLDKLNASNFPANNAVEMQYVDLALDGTVQDVTSQFDFTGVTEDFRFPFPEDELPLAFSASAIVPSTGFPIGPVTSPIHLVFDDTPPAPAGFDLAKDFLSFHHDFAPDPDDFHASVANYTIAQSLGIENYTFVVGAYSKNAWRVRNNLQSFKSEFFDAQGIEYVDADADYQANGNFQQSGAELGQKWLPTLQKGGDIYVADGGQADVALEAVKYIQSQGFSPSRVTVVQHSQWNINQTGDGVIDELQALGATWTRVDDGNVGGNNTPDWRESNNEAVQFEAAALAGPYSEIWQTAFDFLSPYGVGEARVDFSDAVETFHILGLETADAPDINGFADYFLSGDNQTPTTSNEINVLNFGTEVVTEGSFAQVSIASEGTVPSSEMITVNYTITPTGGAIAGADFAPLGTELLNANGSYSGSKAMAGSTSILSISLQVFDDAGYDPGEGFSVTIDSVSSNAVLGKDTTAIFEIVDNDAPAAGDVITAINAGGDAVTQNGIDYEADTTFIGGNTYFDGASGNDSTGNNAAFGGTIYETQRYARRGAGTSFEYSIDVEDGFYDVELNLAEIFQDTAGERMFNVHVEGKQILSNFDILAENAGDTQATLAKVIKGVYSGLDGDATKLNIRFSNGAADRAKLSGLVIRQGEEAAPEVVRAINTGGGALEQDGIDYEADTLFTGGKTYTDGSNVDRDRTGNQAALDGTVSETERWGSSFSYAIDVAEAGEYNVDLLFSEIYFDQPGTRLFNVDIEGARVLTNYDILTEGEGNVNTQLNERFSDINSDDSGSATAIDIDFHGVIQNAKVSGIIITQDTPLEAMTGDSEIDALTGIGSDDMLSAVDQDLF